MRSGPRQIFSLEEVAEVENYAIDEHAISAYTLMSRAGTAAVEAAVEMTADNNPERKRWLVVCGAGNNAGDGYVVARLARDHGFETSVIALVDPKSLTGAAAKAHREFAEQGGTVEPWSGSIGADVDLIIDAILGSGRSRPLDGTFAEAVAAINQHPSPVIALDLPTGLDGSTGKTNGAAVLADATMTFVALKTGIFVGEGPEHCGLVLLADLGIPGEAFSGKTPDYRLIDETVLPLTLPRRRRTSHKGDFGHVLVLAGGIGMPGAARLAGEAALRSGAGRVTVATHPSHAAGIVASRPELMVRPVKKGANPETLLQGIDVVAVGPGLGTSVWAKEMVDLIVDGGRPAVWDADALNLLAKRPQTAKNRIITPHPGEAARLLQISTDDVQQDRKAAVNELQKRYGGTVVLKGADTLVSSVDTAPWLCNMGNPGMASPGMGDVLTGIIAALLAQGLGLEAAAVVGTEAHALAGDLAARSGERGMLASDLLEHIRTVVNPHR